MLMAFESSVSGLSGVPLLQLQIPYARGFCCESCVQQPDTVNMTCFAHYKPYFSMRYIESQRIICLGVLHVAKESGRNRPEEREVI